MQVTCPRCGRIVPGADIDLASRSAVCRPCSEVIALPAVAPATAAALAVTPSFGIEPGPSTSASLYRPTDLSWAEAPESGGGSEVVITPSRAAAFGLLFFALFWDGFLVFWYANVTSAKHVPLMAVLFPMLHVAVGAFVTYSALCGLFNRTYVRLGSDAFDFRRAPIPQRGAVTEPTMNIAGFEVARVRGGAMRMQSRGSSSTPTWGLHLLTRDGRSISLGFGFSDPSHAEFAASRLTQMLADVARGGTTYRG